MPIAVTMPHLGDTVSDATISRWLRSPGDLVEKDEPLLEVSTDKVDTEITAPASGRLTEILFHEGDTSPVGVNLALIDDSASAAHSATPGSEPADTRRGAPYVTPLVRRLAAERGVDLTAMTGSGVGNRIRKADVLAAAGGAASDVPVSPRTPAANPYLSPLVGILVAQRGVDVTTVRGSGRNNRIRAVDISPRGRRTDAATAARPDRTEKLTRLRKVIAVRMVESLRTSAQLTTVVEVDLTAVNHLRGQHGAAFTAAHGIKLSFTPFFLRATATVLGSFPTFNASLDMTNGTVTYHGGIHLNVAVDTDRGLVAPVIRNADSLDIDEIALVTQDLANRARANTLTVDDMSGGTFTVTNTGSRGALFDTPIINQPQVAILGTGAVVARATVIRDERGNENVTVRNIAYLALTYDHRLIDGGDAARFLTAVKARLEAADFAAELTAGT
ncbi:2-oxo acid dehydrogenase subunit E2 [Mycobacterium sp. AT1]|uniref:2-oxo acid dehydrogenase subunit E2 n=1 Tax=Mycobacterium sp. AT1 TaxID=1961706 RepID=UPI0009AE0116|nr:2-oxo acid dehydrogenase subunit E2 [Mycobacterium sp. AT1]OPX12930.1 hypothetical protein B1790_01720 [Mycobacterium sp. AT1]